MTQRATQADILRFFSGRGARTSFVDRLKIRYRPYICPFRQLLEYVAGHDAVFDIGCGSGQLCLLVGEFSKARRIHGIEIDEKLIRNARAEVSGSDVQNTRISFTVFDGANIPEIVRDFDLVFMVDVLHHIPRDAQEKFLKQLYERMGPGARLVLKDIDAASPFVLANRLHDRVLSGAVGHEWTFARARNFCDSLGFTVVNSRFHRIGIYPHYFLHLEK